MTGTGPRAAPIDNTPRGHVGAWRSACAIPSLCGSVLVLVLVFGGLGAWTNLALAGWLAVAAALMHRRAERAVVVIAYGYRRFTVQEATLLDPACRYALQRCSVPADQIDFYVCRKSRGVNGYAAGGRSVAVAAGLVQALEDGRLSERQAAAIMIHEIGHIRGRATRYGLAVGWLTAPWRAAAAPFRALLRAILRHLPTARAALLLTPVIGAVAVIQAIEHHAWPSLAALIGLMLAAWVQPLTDAAVSRASERAADVHTADCGSGIDLADVLATFATGDTTSRWRASHPHVSSRVEQLTAQPATR